MNDTSPIIFGSFVISTTTKLSLDTDRKLTACGRGCRVGINDNFVVVDITKEPKIMGEV